MFGAIANFLLGRSGSSDESEYLGSDMDCDSAVTEALYHGLDERDVTIAKQGKVIGMQHEMITEYVDVIKRYEIDRYELVKKDRPDLAHHYVPGTCVMFPEPDGWDKKPEKSDR